MTKIAVLIDGGHLRQVAKGDGQIYNNDFIEKIAHTCCGASEHIQRILYYDCAPFVGTVTLPISGGKQNMSKPDAWLNELARRELFAVRRGILKFRGWLPKKIPIAPSAAALKDSDFKPDFEQRGVDMRIGLDMANYSANRSVDLTALVTNDTDCIPAMKYARRAGLQVALVCVPSYTPAPELLSHCDFVRKVSWP